MNEIIQRIRNTGDEKQMPFPPMKHLNPGSMAAYRSMGGTRIEKYEVELA